MAPATSLPLESGNNILFPPMYDLVWSVIPFVILLVVAITVATVEYTRKRDVVASLGWELSCCSSPSSDLSFGQ